MRAKLSGWLQGLIEVNNGKCYQWFLRKICPWRGGRALSLQRNSSSLWSVTGQCCRCWSFSPRLPYAETVGQQRRSMSLRTKEKVNNAKSLAFLSSWVFFFLDRAADRPVSNTEPNYLPGVKENVSFGCSGFSPRNKSQPWDPGFIWFNKDFKERKSFPCFYWEGLVICVCFIRGSWLVWPAHIKSHSGCFWA